MPYRSWCESCVEGRGLGEQRGRHAGRVHETPRVVIDYWHITTGNLKLRKELADEYPLNAEGDAALQTARAEQNVMKCLIARCNESKAVFAHAIPVKGDDEDHYVADLVATDVAFMGHIKLIIKTDNEPALRKLATVALERIRCQVGQEDSTVEKISAEQSAAYESASNGGTECGTSRPRAIPHHQALHREAHRTRGASHSSSVSMAARARLPHPQRHEGRIRWQDGLEATPWSRLRTEIDRISGECILQNPSEGPTARC
jgi:hypothetical protein